MRQRQSINPYGPDYDPNAPDGVGWPDQNPLEPSGLSPTQTFTPTMGLNPAVTRRILTDAMPDPGPEAGPANETPAATSTTADHSLRIGADASNKFGGTTYAGFSPQAHQGANLMDPMNAKYALQQYMVDNGALTGGPQGNAQQIADALNAQYGEAYGDKKFFRATDAETIEMPDGTYVHAAPVGYGMARGTYDPSSTNEVFWGARGGPEGSPLGLGPEDTQIAQADDPRGRGYRGSVNPPNYRGYGPPSDTLPAVRPTSPVAPSPQTPVAMPTAPGLPPLENAPFVDPTGTGRTFPPSGRFPSVDPNSAMFYPSIANANLQTGPDQLQALLNRLALIAGLPNTR